MKKKLLVNTILCVLFFTGGCSSMSGLLNTWPRETSMETNSQKPITSKTNENTKMVSPTPTSNLPTTDPAMPYFISYWIGKNAFYEFIQSPSFELLNDKQKNIRICKYSKTESKKIKCEVQSEEPVEVYEYEEGIYRLSLENPVYNSLIDFAGNKNAMEVFLEKEGIKIKINSAVIVVTYNIPAVIWVKAGKEDYFITLNDNLIDDILYSHETTYVYRFYTHGEYYAKFKQKTGKLYIAGQLIPSSQVLFEYNDALLPLIPIINGLGGSFDWVDATHAIITFKKDTFSLDTEKVRLVKNNESKNIFEILPGGYRTFIVTASDILVDDFTLQNLLDYFNKEITVDYNNLTVNID